jgi:S1-C subfamily serine protease
MDPPQQSRRVFDVVYKHKYVLPERPRTVVSVSSIRGPVGRVGLRKGDRVTHVNDMPWDGTSQQLMEYIYDCKQRHPNEDISLTVNADKETAQFLHVRYNMMRQARQEAAAANANKGSARK